MRFEKKTGKKERGENILEGKVDQPYEAIELREFIKPLIVTTNNSEKNRIL